MAGSRPTRRCQRVDPAGSLRVFASTKETAGWPTGQVSLAQSTKARLGPDLRVIQKTRPPKHGFHDACSGDLLTRRREECGHRDARAEVDAHPLRPRIGTKPAASRPLADREVPNSLREDWG